MNRWKASLGLNSGEPIADPNDPRKCIIKSLALQVDGREDVVIDLSSPGSVDSLKDKPFKIKEGAKFHIKVVFQVHHEVLSGLKYLQVVKRKGIRVSKDEEMLGSYAPNTTSKVDYSKECELNLGAWLARYLCCVQGLGLLTTSLCSQRGGGPLRHDRSGPLQRRVQVH